MRCIPHKHLLLLVATALAFGDDRLYPAESDRMYALVTNSMTNETQVGTLAISVPDKSALFQPLIRVPFQSLIPFETGKQITVDPQRGYLYAHVAQDFYTVDRKSVLAVFNLGTRKVVAVHTLCRYAGPAKPSDIYPYTTVLFDTASGSILLAGQKGLPVTAPESAPESSPSCWRLPRHFPTLCKPACCSPDGHLERGRAALPLTSKCYGQLHHDHLEHRCSRNAQALSEPDLWGAQHGRHHRHRHRSLPVHPYRRELLWPGAAGVLGMG